MKFNFFFFLFFTNKLDTSDQLARIFGEKSKYGIKIAEYTSFLDNALSKRYN